MVADNTFADRIMTKYTRFGSYRGRETGLVLFGARQRKTVEIRKVSTTPAVSLYKLLLRFYMTWQNYVRSGQRISVSRDISDKTSRSYKEYAAFWNIATIFTNRGSRPDLAKKAERELLRMLSFEFYEEMIPRRWRRENGESQTLIPGDRQEELRRMQNCQRELGSTKRMVGMLEEQIKVQETILTELRQKMLVPGYVPETNIKKITGEVIKQMDREMHLERLRQGM